MNTAIVKGKSAFEHMEVKFVVKPGVTIMVGLPKSGKTTYVENKFKGSYPIICADQLRKIIYNRDFWEDGEDLVWGIRKVMLRTLFEQGVSMVVDETNLSKVRRANIIKLARSYDYFVDIIYINTPKEECIRRANAEKAYNMIEVIERMSGTFEKITPGEYDFLKIVEWDGSEIS